MAIQTEVVRLLIECRTDLFAFILAAIRDYDAAEEVMQNVSVVICEKSEQYQSGTSFRAWAREIARRQVLQYFRESKRGPSALAPADLEHLVVAFSEIEQDVAVDERIRALRACLANLSNRLRELFRLRYEERLSLEQMAERMSRKSESVRKALYRGRMALRECIDRRLGIAN